MWNETWCSNNKPTVPLINYDRRVKNIVFHQQQLWLMLQLSKIPSVILKDWKLKQLHGLFFLPNGLCYLPYKQFLSCWTIIQQHAVFTEYMSSSARLEVCKLFKASVLPLICFYDFIGASVWVCESLTTVKQDVRWSGPLGHMSSSLLLCGSDLTLVLRRSR